MPPVPHVVEATAAHTQKHPDTKPEKNLETSLEKKPEPARTGDVVESFAHRPLTSQELDAARNCVSSSRHTKLTVLPNHAINLDGELEGFVFECCADDLASALPLTKASFGTTAVYECLPDGGQTFLQLSANVAQNAEKLLSVVRGLEEEPADPLKFDCMPDWENSAISQHNLRDQRTWREEVPAKVGVYHAFMRTAAQNTREHKIFIVVSGHCRHASEELYNLWLDARETITAKQFMECAEVDWLRKATLRHHNRLAARVARRLNLNVRFLHDVDAVSNAPALLPTTSCVYRDLALKRGQVVLSSDAVLLEACNSGVIFDCFASEGFWVFMGPRDTGSFRMFGMEMRSSCKNTGFCSKTVRHHHLFPAREKANVVAAPSVRALQPASSTRAHTSCYKLGSVPDSPPTCSVLFHRPDSHITGFLFPHTDFVGALGKLGFCLNDGITNLMPIVAYVEDE